MARRIRCAFVHQYGFAGMAYDSRGGAVSLVFAAKIEETGDSHVPYLAEAVVLPGHFGVGTTEENAIESLTCVMEKYLQLFVEQYGPDALSKHFVEEGFQVVHGALEQPNIADEWKSAFVTANFAPTFSLAQA